MKRILLIIALLSSNLIFAQNKVGRSVITPQSTYTPNFKIDGTNAKVRNVILLIGDGMGYGALCSGMYANADALTITNLHQTGIVRTQSADNFTTDSAASGSAYATGIKTNNGYLGVDPEGNKVPNIPEKLAPKGIISGVVSSDDLHSATPAAFFAHQNSRNKVAEIWADLVNSVLTFASGGTKRIFLLQDTKTQEALQEHFTLIYDPNDETVNNSSRLIYLPETMKLGDRGNYLPETTKMAIEYLNARSKKGFFLMVEGAHIDHEAHSNNYKDLVPEMLDFDKAVEEAIRFAEKDGHTLVIVTADHETGGVTLVGRPEEGVMMGSFGSKGHTGIVVPLFAYGPHSKDFVGVQENSDVSNKIMTILGK